MEYLDLNPKEVLGFNTVAVQICMEMVDQQQRNLLTQMTSEVPECLSPGFHAYYKAIAESDEAKSLLALEKKMLSDACTIIAESVKKEYDVIFERTVEKTRDVIVDVPKVRKVGIFKKEEYMDHETRTEKYYEKEHVAYKGWRIEHLFRQEGNGYHASICYFDYVLGADGKLYLIVSSSENGTRDVYECIPFTQGYFNNTFCNIYTSVMGGMVGALDAIPIDTDHPMRKIHLSLDDDYYYNFPIQIDDTKDYPYRFSGGVIKRLLNLLSEEEKQRVLNQYSWLGTIN